MILIPTRANTLNRYEMEILSLAVGAADSERMAQIVDAYDSCTTLSLYVYRAKLKTCGIIGCETLDAQSARIQHIAVNSLDQHGGVGRLMIRAAVQELGFKSLQAETDADAVGFYAACGFAIESLGEKYPGVERFECTLRAAPIGDYCTR